MENPPPVPQKKGLGPLAWVGIGCGGIVVLSIVAVAVVSLFFGSKIKKFAEDAQSNPTRMMASGMVAVSSGQIEMVAQDDVKKRYTVREKRTGKLTTIYWSEKNKAPEVVEGDFSAIPASENAPDETPPLPEPK